jgi:hypothetical protein
VHRKRLLDEIQKDEDASETRTNSSKRSYLKRAHSR